MRLRHEAQRRGITVSELTGEAIDSHLGPHRQTGLHSRPSEPL